MNKLYSTSIILAKVNTKFKRYLQIKSIKKWD